MAAARPEEERAATVLFVEVDKSEQRNIIDVRTSLLLRQLAGPSVSNREVALDTLNTCASAAVRKGRKLREVFRRHHPRDFPDEGIKALVTGRQLGLAAGVMGPGRFERQ